MPRNENKVYIQCSCGSPEHLLQFEKDEDYVYVYVLLIGDSFFKRLYNGIKYIFGYKCRYGHFDEILLNQETTKELVEFLNKPV